MPGRLRTRAAIAVAARHGLPPAMPWLTAAAEREALERLRRRGAEAPVRWDRAVSRQATHRCFMGAAGSLAAIGRRSGTRVDQPLRRPGIMGMLAGAYGRRGPCDLRAVHEALCGDQLPASLLSPAPPLDLTPIFFAEASRAFAGRFDGSGLDEAIVDVEALRRNWLGARPDPRTACLLQHAWLCEQASVSRLTATTT